MYCDNADLSIVAACKLLRTSLTVTEMHQERGVNPFNCIHYPTYVAQFQLLALIIVFYCLKSDNVKSNDTNTTIYSNLF